jgi:hypothetical protein
VAALFAGTNPLRLGCETFVFGGLAFFLPLDSFIAVLSRCCIENRASWQGQSGRNPGRKISDNFAAVDFRRRFSTISRWFNFKERKDLGIVLG